MDAAGEGEAWKENGEQMSGPDEPAWKYSDAFFKDVLRTAVPERRKELDDLFGQHSVTITPNRDENSMRFCVNVESGEITVATAPLPRVWGHSYAYLRVYDLIAKKKSEDAQACSISDSDPEYANAIAVLKWAMTGDAKAVLKDDTSGLGPQAFPADLKLPFDPGAVDATHKVASDLTVMALGFILLHELAHLELKHSADVGVDSIAQEREADAWAAAFMLDRCEEYADKHGHKPSDVHKKRLLAVVMGELWMLHFEVQLGVKDAETHPPMYDRLARLLDQHGGGGAGIGWAMAATILTLHYQARYGMVEHGDGFDDFEQCYQCYADLLSKRPKRAF